MYAAVILIDCLNLSQPIRPAAMVNQNPCILGMREQGGGKENELLCVSDKTDDQ
jgi:hypothetical protein